MFLPDHLVKIIATLLLLRHTVFEIIKNGEEKEYLGHDKEDNKEDLPPAVNHDMVAVFRLNIDESVIGRGI